MEEPSRPTSSAGTPSLQSGIWEGVVRAFLIAMALALSGCTSLCSAGNCLPSQSQETARDAALRECTGKASEWTDRDWETTKSATYANCMTSHGQIP